MADPNAPSGPPSPFRRQPRVTAQPDAAQYPALLDASQWTLAATFSHDDRFTGPSERIGRYYRQRLDEMTAEQLEQRRAQRTAGQSPLRPTIDRRGWATGLPCRSLLPPMAADEQSPTSPDLGSSALQILTRQREAKEEAERAMYVGTQRSVHITDPANMHERMSRYVREGIDQSCLAPFNEEWTDNAMEQVPTELGGVDPLRVDEMISDMTAEVKERYYDAVKLSMVEYVLKSSEEGRRGLARPLLLCWVSKPELAISHSRARWRFHLTVW